MEIRIALAPNLAVNSADFVDAWNQNAQTTAVATASTGLSKSPLEAFPLDPQVQQALIFLGGVAGGIAIDILKDTVKTFITDLIERRRQQRAQQRPPTIRVETVPQPGGAVLLVVHEEKA
ncbi:MAG: hypothetical protein DYG89_13165 [Caldilinea sp. CFX5]|nr:hypothetical protein [Caldilinea sp. CFX5]